MDHSSISNQFTQTKLAAKAGDVAALNKLKISYFNGEHPFIDIDSAVSHLRDESRKGDPEAQYTLGQFYFYAIGVSQDSDQAVKFWRKAAEQGLPEAQHSMGQACSFLNIGGQMNHSEAVSWFAKAADQGHIEAISRISIQAGLFLVYTLIYKLIQFKPLLINALYSLTVFLSVPSFLFFGLKNPITICFLELSIGILVFYIFRSFNEKWLMDMVLKNEETYADAIEHNKIIIKYKN
jgi:TPR repeat protein